MFVLHGHPLSSFHQKAAVAFYDTGTPFEFAMLDLGDEAERARFTALWPFGKMPVLEDRARGQVVGESTAVIEHLAATTPAAARLIPADPETARRTRLMDRIFDLYVQAPFQRFGDHRREVPGARDEAIPELVKGQLATAYGYLEGALAGRAWAAGEDFTLADCGAGPALFYANRILPIADHPNIAAYFERLKARPSYARAFEESKPYLDWVPF
ncbi:glutathione S-transferase family protein [Phenylobacterium soli]|uniref:Glutathione S-transferase family protein n=2 Tax=Phenylobacterium soli TaxID=2170551 RepID=A0A328APY5_9CAUL|nr:glutathione S-transferase family protein [Phenylobacterium soli]